MTTKGEKLKADLYAIALDTIATYKRTARKESKRYLSKVTLFSKTADALTLDLIRGKLTKDQYLDGLDNIALSMRSYLLAKGYKETRRHLAILVKVLQRIASIVGLFFA